MTREEAAKYLGEYSSTNGSGRCTQEQHEEAKKMAIQALSQEPTFDDECQKDLDEAWEQIQKKRKRIPVTQKSGKWENLYRCWMCSECGKLSHIEHNYCPNCGAKMFEPQESEDK